MSAERPSWDEIEKLIKTAGERTYASGSNARQGDALNKLRLTYAGLAAEADERATLRELLVELGRENALLTAKVAGLEAAGPALPMVPPADLFTLKGAKVAADRLEEELDSQFGQGIDSFYDLVEFLINRRWVTALPDDGVPA